MVEMIRPCKSELGKFVLAHDNGTGINQFLDSDSGRIRRGVQLVEGAVAAACFQAAEIVEVFDTQAETCDRAFFRTSEVETGRDGDG